MATLAKPIEVADSPLVVEDKVKGRFRVHRSAFTDQEVFERERAQIFDRCWLYFGHESELPNPNDFLTRNIAGRELIFNRDRKGEFHAFYNTCPHRGALVVREPRGNALAFRCFYHGWAFNNNGAFATRDPRGGYPEDFNEGGCVDLPKVAHLAGYRGFYFINFDPGAISLEDYLGDARDILDLISEHGPDGMEILGQDQRYSIHANWKLLVENSFDGYHAADTHSTYFAYLTGAIGEQAALPDDTTVWDFGNGHASIEGEAPWGRPVARWIPAWGEEAKAEVEAIKAELVARVGPKRADRICRTGRNTLIFPNLIINDIMSLTIRTFYPTAPGEMNVSSWAMGVKGETPSMRERRLNNFLEFLGPGGFATPDDVEALEAAQRGYGAVNAAPWNDISRGMLRKEKFRFDDEEQMRCFWREWNKQMGGSK